MSATDDVAEKRREVDRWIAVANEDLRAARACLSIDEPALGAAAYHCQQAAEKLIKGLLVAASVSFRKTHDMDELVDLAAPCYPQIVVLLDACRSLTVWGFVYRYPSIEDVDEPQPTVAAIESKLILLADLRRAVAPLGS